MAAWQGEELKRLEQQVRATVTCLLFFLILCTIDPGVQCNHIRISLTACGKSKSVHVVLTETCSAKYPYLKLSS